MSPRGAVAAVADERPGVAKSVAVIVPARDRGGVLARALESVACQRTAAAEVIVVDDGSTDDTAEVAKRYGATVLRNAVAQGSGPARNQGIAVARSDWIAFLDSDDEWFEDHLTTVLGYAGEYDLVAAATVDNFGRRRGWLGARPRQISLDMLFFPENVVSTSATLIRRSLLEELEGFRSLDRTEDLDLWVRALRLGSGVAVPKVTSKYHRESPYFSAELHRRGRAGGMRALEGLAATNALSRITICKIRARTCWDDLREALHQGAVVSAIMAASQFATHPIWCLGLLEVLAYRRRARKK